MCNIYEYIIIRINEYFNSTGTYDRERSAPKKTLWVQQTCANLSGLLGRDGYSSFSISIEIIECMSLQQMKHLCKFMNH